jgi:hypothetical protein
MPIRIERLRCNDEAVSGAGDGLNFWYARIQASQMPDRLSRNKRRRRIVTGFILIIVAAAILLFAIASIRNEHVPWVYREFLARNSQSSHLEAVIAVINTRFSSGFRPEEYNSLGDINISENVISQLGKPLNVEHRFGRHGDEWDAWYYSEPVFFASWPTLRCAVHVNFRAPLEFSP